MALPPDQAPTEPEGSRRAAKSADAFRTISEVADELAVPQHVLRFWESRFPQIRPLKRGGGRRYYRPEDVDVLRRVAQLLYQEGYTIKGAQRLLRTGPPKPERGTAATETLPLELLDHEEIEPPEPKRLARRPQAPIGPVTDPAARAILRSILEELEDLRDLLPRKQR